MILFLLSSFLPSSGGGEKGRMDTRTYMLCSPLLGGALRRPTVGCSLRGRINTDDLMHQPASLGREPVSADALIRAVYSTTPTSDCCCCSTSSCLFLLSVDQSTYNKLVSRSYPLPRCLPLPLLLYLPLLGLAASFRVAGVAVTRCCPASTLRLPRTMMNGGFISPFTTTTAAILLPRKHCDSGRRF